MISTELANLADWCIGWGARKPPPSDPSVIFLHLASVLMDLSQQAAALERLPIDEECRVGASASVY
jgi:hypothetical protein